MKRSCALVSFCLISLVSLPHEQAFAAYFQNDNLKRSNASSAAASDDHSQEPFVIEQYSTTVRYEDDGTGERDLAVRIHVLNDAGVQQLGELAFQYNSANEKIEVRYVRVIKADHTVVTAAADAVKDLSAPGVRNAPIYAENREKHITVPPLSAGEVLEYEIVTHVVTPPALEEFWFDHTFLDQAVVLNEILVVNVPTDRVLSLESPNFRFEKTEENSRTVYRWKHTHLNPPLEKELSNGKERASNKVPDVRLSTFTSWAAVARWYAKLEEGRARPTPEIRAKVTQLVENRATAIEKAKAIYDYVARNIRYVKLSFGPGGYQPLSAAEVFTHKYGDSNDEHALLDAMLQAAGIPSDAGLIPTSRKLDISLPSPAQFDHVITTIQDGKDLIWMDPTTEVAPFGLLNVSLRDKSALLVSSGGDGRIVRTPLDPPFASRQQVEIVDRVDNLGKLTGHVRYTMRGDTEFILRTAFHKTPQTQWNQIGQTILTLDGLQGEVNAVTPSDPSDTDKPFVLDLDFSQTNFLDWSVKKTKVAVPLLSIGLPKASDDNKWPIELGSPLDVRTHLTLTLPAHFTAQTPVAIAISRDFADFRSEYKSDGQILTASRSLNFKAHEVPASRTSDYLAFVRAVTDDESQPLLIENSSMGAPAIPSDAKPAELLESGVADLNSGNERAAIPLLRRVVELEPQHKEAWNDLGLAYLRVGRLEEAASAFRKQIEVNPKDDHSFNYLGVTLQQQQKYAEAADAFRKQINLSPLDPFAHAALGGLLLAQHRYDEAAPELDKATVLSPDDAELQVSLGQAYLKLGEKEKALPVFQKALDLSQTPAVLNNIAFDLADSKTELDRAQQYAESAISSTAALRNPNLAHLTLADLSETASMAAYWDTLGWVYFNQGKFEQAERFIHAAWSLGEEGEVGDHLGQIAEKRGDKKEAVRLYARALAAPHSIPDTRARLTLLLGGNSQIDALVDQAKPELERSRTFPAGKLLSEDASADFFFLISPLGTDGSSTRVDAVQFINGSQKLRPFAENLRHLDFGTMFPDASPVKLVRRGTVTCSASSGECTVRLAISDDVRTLK
jgi:Flp pilus assembly protein TadD